MKKIISVSLIVIFIYFIFLKFDFLFFRIKLCNNTNKNMYIYVHWERDSIIKKLEFNKLLEKIFVSYKRPSSKIPSVWLYVEAKSCSKFFNTNLMTNALWIESFIYGENIYLNCKDAIIDWPSFIRNLDYGDYIFDINKYKVRNINNNYNFCTLYWNLRH